MSSKRKRGAVPKSQGVRYRYRQDGTVRGYEVRYRDPLDPSKVRGKSFKTLEEAKAFQIANRHSIQQGTYIAPSREATTWRSVSREWLESRRVKLRARSIEGYEGVLGRWLDRWDQRAISSITRHDVRNLLNDVRAQGRAEETEHRIFNIVSAVCTFAVQEGYIKNSPADAVRKELRSTHNKEFRARALTLAEALKIIDCLPAGRNHLFGLLGLWTGFRAGELAGLRVHSIDRLRNVVQVDETVEDLGGVLRSGVPKTKKSRGRRVPIPKAVMDQVGAYIDTKRLKPDDYLFALNSEFFHYQNWRNRHWVPACKRAGIVVRFYDLRHTFASLRAQQGVPPHVLKEWMGHSSITTTMNIYSHVYQEDKGLEALVERLYANPADDSTRTDLPTVEEA